VRDLLCDVINYCDTSKMSLNDEIIIIIIIIDAKIKVTLSHKFCRGTIHKSLSQVGHWSNVSYTAAAAAQLLTHRAGKLTGTTRNLV